MNKATFHKLKKKTKGQIINFQIDAVRPQSKHYKNINDWDMLQGLKAYLELCNYRVIRWGIVK